MASTRNRRYTQEEWNEHRWFIENMYPLKGITLPAIADFLKRHKGFDATERQYKRKIHQWGLEKKVKRDEMRQIALAMHQLSLQGKSTAFFVRKKRVDDMKIRRFVRRTGFTQEPSMHGASISDHEDPSTQKELPTGIWVETHSGHSTVSRSFVSTMNDITMHDIEDFDSSADYLQMNNRHTSLPSSSPYTQNSVYESNLTRELSHFQCFESQKMQVQSGLAEFSWELIIDFDSLWNKFGLSHLQHSKTPLKDALTFEEPYVLYHSEEEIQLKENLFRLERQPCQDRHAILEALESLIDELYVTDCVRVLAQYLYLFFNYARELEGVATLRTLRSLSQISEICRIGTGQISTAEMLSTMVRERAQRILSPNSRDMLYINLRATYCLELNGKYQEALRLNSESLYISRATLDTDDKILLYLTENLATLLNSNGDFEEAENLTREIILGSSSKNVTYFRNSLYLVQSLNNQMELLEAEQLCRENLSQPPEILRPESQIRLEFQYELARCLRRQDRFDESEEIGRELIEKYISIFGNMHIETLMVKEGLFYNLRHQQKLEEAEELGFDLLEAFTESVGPDHPETHWFRVLFGDLWYQQGQFEEALEYYEVAHEGLKRHRGEMHYQTKGCYEVLQNIWSKLGIVARGSDGNER